jgi:serine/threonine-protein kinase RsbW
MPEERRRPPRTERDSMNATRASYRLDSTLESTHKAEVAARAIAMKSGFHEEEADNIATAVREAALNAVLHGNKCDLHKHVTLLIEATQESLTVWLRDEGEGVDTADIPDPLAPENLLKESGRGIFLIRTFMDEVRFRNINPGTEVTMIKHVREATREGQEASK